MANEEMKEVGDELLPEAPISVTIKGYYKGFSVLFTKRHNQDEEIELDNITKSIDSLIGKGFMPSWNTETNGKTLNPVSTTPVCAIHGVPMVWKSGISKKTGKPYAFWGCDVRNPDGSYCVFNPSLPVTKGVVNTQTEKDLPF